MNEQHLSDEAVTACADGYLSGLARDRAARHIAKCAECAAAVRAQREAVLTLRAAAAPALPTNLLDRLRAVPQTTPISTLPTAIAPDGSTVLATSTKDGGSFFAPMAALVPSSTARESRLRARPLLTGAALVALAGALAAVPATSGGRAVPVAPQPVQQISHTDTGPGGGITPVSDFRPIGR